VPTTFAWVGRGLVATLGALAAIAAFGAPLFPRPLHLVRRIEDPISHQTSTIDQYCAGNRIVDVRGARVVITDFDAQTITEIDHEDATWSVTKFDAVARALPHPKSGAKSDWEPMAGASSLRPNTRGLEWHSLTREADHSRLDVGVDRTITLSRDALDALLGAAYPNPKSDVADAIARAARGSHDNEFALPMEQSVTVNAEGDSLTFKNTVIAARSEAVPDEVARLLAAKPGSTQVESHITRTARELESLDRLPARDKDASTRKP
jgi:hypothetical protein